MQSLLCHSYEWTPALAMYFSTADSRAATLGDTNIDIDLAQRRAGRNISKAGADAHVTNMCFVKLQYDAFLACYDRK